MSLHATDPFSGVPLYLQISQSITRDIQNDFVPGSRLPTESVLAERFSVNRHTLRRAIDEMVAAGLVERRRGLGVFVLDDVLRYGIHKHSRFTETLEAAGNATESTLLHKQLISAKDGVARRLDLSNGQEVIWLETLRRVNDRPFSVVSHFLPGDLCRPVFDAYQGGSLHECVAVHLRIRLERRLSLITSRLPQGDDAILLGISRHQPVLRVKSVNVNQADGIAVEYALTRFRSDRVELEIKL